MQAKLGSGTKIARIFVKYEACCVGFGVQFYIATSFSKICIVVYNSRQITLQHQCRIYNARQIHHFKMCNLKDLEIVLT